jgi:hypothetical protein
MSVKRPLPTTDCAAWIHGWPRTQCTRPGVELIEGRWLCRQHFNLYLERDVRHEREKIENECRDEEFGQRLALWAWLIAFVPERRQALRGYLCGVGLHGLLEVRNLVIAAQRAAVLEFSRVE